ncbi:MAG: hypothetical protein ABIO72_02635 [Patescibacteria group bacterium]
MKQFWLKTDKRSFEVNNGVCTKVVQNGQKAEVHPALGKQFLGGVYNRFVDEVPVNPPRTGQFLAFRLKPQQGDRKERRVYSDVPLVEETTQEPTSQRPSSPSITVPTSITVTRKNTPSATRIVRTSFN